MDIRSVKMPIFVRTAVRRSRRTPSGTAGDLNTGWPLVHVSFKYRNFRPVPAKGIIAIGQFGIGVVSIAQFGAGIFSLGQFVVSMYALAQFALAYSAVAQIGLVVNEGYGQVIYYLQDLLKFL